MAHIQWNHRPTSTGIRNVHAETGICRFRDKDNPSGYKARLLWVPPDLLAELWRYEAHLAEVCRILCYPNTLRGVAGFFLDGQGRPELIRPVSIRRLTQDFFPFPANAHRRIMMQALRRCSCPSEITKTYLGHWNSDQEPWSDFSGLSMQVIRDGFAQYVPPLLSYFGFGPLHLSEPSQ